VAAVFTVRELEERLPVDMARVILDEAPTRATWRHGALARDIDLFLHDGLRLEGEAGVEGAAEEVVVLGRGAIDGDVTAGALTHRELMAAARSAAQSARLGTRDHTLTLVPFSSRLGLVQGLAAPLLAGGRVRTALHAAPDDIVARLEQEGISVLVAGADSYLAVAEHLALRGGVLDAPVLQRCFTHDASIDAPLQARWLALTGVAISWNAG